MIPLDEPVLLFDSTWIRASNLAESGTKVMTRRGNSARAFVSTKHYLRHHPVFRVTLSDGSWFRTTDGSAWAEEFDTLDTNHGGAKPGPRLEVKSIESLPGTVPCVAVSVASVDSAGHETGGLIVCRNYVMIRADG